MSAMPTGLGPPRRFTKPCKYPELLDCLRVWILGHEARAEGGGKSIMPLVLLTVNHEHQPDLIRRDVFPGDDPDELGSELDAKIEMNCKQRNQGMTGSAQLLEVVAMFQDEGRAPHYERMSMLYTNATPNPSFGQSGYTGFMGRDLSNPQNVTISMHKTMIDATEKARIATETALRIVVDDNKAKAVRIQKYEEMHLTTINQQQDLLNQQVERDQARAVNAWKISSLDAVVKKALAVLPMIGVSASRALRTWMDEKKGRLKRDPTPREQRAVHVIRKLLEAAEASGKAPNPEVLRMMLGSIGIDDATIDDVMDMATEFSIEVLEKKVEAESKAIVVDLSTIHSLTQYMPKESDPTKKE